MKKHIVTLLAILTLCVTICISAPKADAATSSYYTYTVSDGKATITECNTSVSGAIMIPSTLGGYPVTTIDFRAFYNCTGLTSVTIPDGVTTIDFGAFEGCTGLQTVAIPDSVTTIGNLAFTGCSSLQSVTIPNSVTTIGAYTFSLCTDLQSVTIPTSVTIIDFAAFAGCSSLTSVTIPDSVTTIHGAAFDGCTGLQSVTIGSGVTTINQGVFYGCTGLRSVTIPDSVTTIGEDAFEHCTGLQSVTIGNRVTIIDDWAFSSCKALSSVTIPASVTTIGDYAFYDCIGLKMVVYCGAEEQWNNIPIGSNNSYLTNASRKYHDYAPATCTTPKTCTICGETESVPAMSHSYADGVCTTCGTAMGGYVVLSADMSLTGLGLTEDLYIDLNGFDLSGTIITNGFKVYGMDSTTDNYTCQEVGLFSCVEENGNPITPVQQFKTDISGSVKRYMAIDTQGGYTFHRIYLAITKVTIRPEQTGFGYKAVFYGDEVVLNQLDSFGFKLQLDGQTKVATMAMDASKLETGREYSLLLQNFDVENFGETDVFAQAFMKLKDGTQIESSTVSYSMKNVLQKLCESLDAISTAQLQALKTMCLPFKKIMTFWHIEEFLK